jgi:hypothetical protein
MEDEQDCTFCKNVSAAMSSVKLHLLVNNHQSKPSEEQNPGQQCSACLYTGVATCTGLSTYFFKVAHFDLPTKGSEQIMLKASKDKRFLLVFGSCWALAGAYRLYLG